MAWTGLGSSTEIRPGASLSVFAASMILNHGLHLAYCTNVHPGEDWAETFLALDRWTLEVKRQLGGGGPYGIGLRLSDLASRELIDPARLREFQRWLDRHDCYVFTINGFPFGQFHGQRVKERVYLPDWTTPERLAYTERLFDLLARLVPPQRQPGRDRPRASRRSSLPTRSTDSDS